MNITFSKLLKHLLSLTVLLSLIFLVLVFFYGIRIPGFQFDNYHAPTTYEIKKQNFHFNVKGGFIKQTGHAFIARANSPHFEISLRGDLIDFPIVIENIHPDATLESSNPYLQIEEKISNLSRQISLQGESQQTTILKWRFPEKSHYRFMAIGDTGGGRELSWSLIRAKQLDADFIMHLGDMFYSYQDAHSAFTAIQSSPIPIYNIYGNHDYYNDGKFPERNTFNKVFSPSNFQFSLLDKTFVSLDTSSHIFPFNKGKRGKFLDRLIDGARPSENETLVFTHQPIANSMYQDRPELEHGITGFEGAWLEQKLIPVKHLTVIAGHVHQSIHISDSLLPTYVAGEGIAHQDLIANTPLSKVLIGDIYPGQLTYFSWQLNRMPRAYQTSLKSRYIFEQHLQNLAASNIDAENQVEPNTN